MRNSEIHDTTALFLGAAINYMVNHTYSLDTFLLRLAVGVALEMINGIVKKHNLDAIKLLFGMGCDVVVQIVGPGSSPT